MLHEWKLWDVGRKLWSENMKGRKHVIKYRRYKDNNTMDFKERECRDVEWVHLAQEWNQHTALFNMVMNCLVPWQAGNFCCSWLSKTMCHAGNYLPPETGLQKWIPLASPVSSLQSLHGHVSPVVVNYTFKCAIHGTASDPSHRLASDCGWNLWLSHILEPEATFLRKEKGGILVKPRTQSRVPSCSCSRIVLTAAMRTRYSVYFQRFRTVLGVYSK